MTPPVTSGVLSVTDSETCFNQSSSSLNPEIRERIPPAPILTLDSPPKLDRLKGKVLSIDPNKIEAILDPSLIATLNKAAQIAELDLNTCRRKKAEVSSSSSSQASATVSQTTETIKKIPYAELYD